MKADLHVHSDYSDGSRTREEIVGLAAERGITQLAFTDHDTTRGFEEAVSMGVGRGIEVVPGIEISAYDFRENRKVHILGYGYTKTDELEELCAPTLARRDANCCRQIRILADMGYRITEEAVRDYSSGTLYKQHILKYLYDTDQSEKLFGQIYREIFKNGGPCDFDIVYVDAREAVRAVRACGGLPVLAHPGQQQNFSVIPDLVCEGLWGIEKNHPSNSREDRKNIQELAQRYGLFCTGGSDYHGLYEANGADLGDFLSENRIEKTGRRL